MKLIGALLGILTCLVFNSCNHKCDNTLCKNGGTCNDGKCDCPPGYSGSMCEIKDSCYNVKCENNGVCKGGNCNCPPTFSGKNCEHSQIAGKKYIYTNGYYSTNGGLEYDAVPGVLAGDTLEAKRGLSPLNMASFGLYLKDSLAYTFYVDQFNSVIGQHNTAHGFWDSNTYGTIFSDGNRLVFEIYGKMSPTDSYSNVGGFGLNAIQ